jgi:hypothetical protein
MMETTVAAMLQATVAMEWRLTLSAAGFLPSYSITHRATSSH